MDEPVERGTLDTMPLPVLLLSLYRQRQTGYLELSREAVRKRVWLRDGVPVLAESNLPSESLGIQLLDAGRIQRDDYARLVETVRERGCKEGAALLALELIAPQELFTALKDQVRRRLLDGFGWPRGDYAVYSGEAPTGDAAAFRCDPVALTQEGVAIHWSPSRIREDLLPHFDRYPERSGRFVALAGRLLRDPDVDRLIDALDGTRSLGQALVDAPGPSALAAAWVLDRLGAIRWLTAATAAADTRQNRDGDELAFEIVVGGQGSAAEERGSAKQGPERASAGKRSPAKPSPSSNAEALANEIRTLHTGLAERDYYELLGVARNASIPDVKRAYLSAAKRFHPDGLVRLGLEELRPQAEELFARIARAHEALSDPARRREYDQGAEGDRADGEAKRVVQAEVLYRKAEVMMRAGNWSGAYDFLRPAVQLWPEESAYQSALGWTLYKRMPSDPATARTHLESALALDERDPVAHFRLSLVLRALGEPDAADREMKRAKQLDPKVR